MTHDQIGTTSPDSMPQRAHFDDGQSDTLGGGFSRGLDSLGYTAISFDGESYPLFGGPVLPPDYYPVRKYMGVESSATPPPSPSNVEAAANIAAGQIHRLKQ